MKNKTAQQIGLQGEMFAKRSLEKFGLDVTWVAQLDLGYDLLVEGVKVEVKTARKNSRGKYQFCLTKCKHADITKSDLVVFQMLLDDGKIASYIVPTIIVANNKQLTVPGNLETYKGLISQFRLA